MSDENELNPNLADDHAAIEAALRDVELPKSAIDHASVMYQSGWAAAMAQRDSHSPSVSKTNSQFWPALAMTFAATTAACLMVIVLPPAEGGMAVAINDSVQSESVAEESQVAVQQPAGDAKSESKLDSPTSTVKEKFGVARLFGPRVEQMMARRNARFEKHLAEAASPPGSSVVSNGDEDWDLEATKPLTSGSAFNFSL